MKWFNFIIHITTTTKPIYTNILYLESDVLMFNTWKGWGRDENERQNI